MEKVQHRVFQSLRSRKFIRFTIHSVLLIGASLAAFIASTSYLTVKSLQAIAPDDPSFKPDVGMVAEILSVDPITRTIVMDWYPTFNKVDCTKSPLVVDIMIDPSLLDVTSPTFAAQPPYPPLFTLNTTDLCLEFITRPSRSFRTITKLLGDATDIPVLPYQGQSTLQNYPFDVYIATFSFSVRNVETGTVKAPRITASYGVAVNFEMSLQESIVLRSEKGNLRMSQLELAFRIERSKATKMFVIMVAITNWLTASAFLIICAAASVYHSHRIYSEMFVVPVGALFAFTSIRANLPGAPTGFGTSLGAKVLPHVLLRELIQVNADMYSTLPVLVIMSFCSFTLLLLVLYRRILDTAAEPHRQDGYQLKAPDPESDQDSRAPSGTDPQITHAENQPNNDQNLGPQRATSGGQPPQSRESARPV